MPKLRRIEILSIRRSAEQRRRPINVRQHDWNQRDSPFVLGPELAMARIPAPVNRSSGWISSSLRADSENRMFRDCDGFDIQLLSVDARPTATRPCGISALDHEVRDNSVKYDAVVVPSSCQLGKILAGLRLETALALPIYCHDKELRTFGACSQ